MGLLTLILVIVIVFSVVNIITISSRKVTNYDDISRRINRIPSLGLLAFVLGLIGQLIGLFTAFRAFRMGAVETSTSVFLEGFRISMVTTVYGLLIGSFSLMVWFLLKKWSNYKSKIL